MSSQPVGYRRDARSPALSPCLSGAGGRRQNPFGHVIRDLALPLCKGKGGGGHGRARRAVSRQGGDPVAKPGSIHFFGGACRDHVGGNIGTAVLTLAPPAPGRVHVVECSSYQIDLAPSLDPSAGLLLNLTPDHLDRHGSMEHYAEIKERLVARSEVAVVAVDDGWTRAIAERLGRVGVRVLRVSKDGPLDDGFFAEGTMIREASRGNATDFADLKDIPTLRGRHNAQNAAAAIAACRIVGLTDDEIRDGLASFPGLKHRMQPVGRRGPVLFVNDSKATNAEAAAPALSSYENIYWIAGGLPKQGGIDALEPLFARVAKAYLIGEAASAFASVFGAHGEFEISGTLANAVAHAARDAAQSPGNAGAEDKSALIIALLAIRVEY